jgi:hypothetical protein
MSYTVCASQMPFSIGRCRFPWADAVFHGPKMYSQSRCNRLKSKQMHYSAAANSRPLMKGSPMKAERIRHLCREVDNQAKSTESTELARAILLIARKEKVSPADLAVLYCRFRTAPANPLLQSVQKSPLEQPLSAVQRMQPARTLPPVEPAMPVRSHTVKVEICLGKACRAKGAEAIYDHFQQFAAADRQQPASQTRYKIKTCSCQGRCGKAPVVILDKKIHEKFNPGE